MAEFDFYTSSQPIIDHSLIIKGKGQSWFRCKEQILRILRAVFTASTIQISMLIYDLNPLP